MDEIERMLEKIRAEEFARNNNLDYIVFKDEIMIGETGTISSQEDLTDIVLGDESYEVKLEALRNIYDDNLDEILECTDDDIIREMIEDIKFERNFKRVHVAGLG